MRCWARRVVAALGILALGPVSAEAAAVLYGVTGDGAATPESLFVIDQTDASTTFFMALGNGEDGEAIGYNPADGRLYHASGFQSGDQYWEAINLATKTLELSTQLTGLSASDEVHAFTYNPDTGNFLMASWLFRLYEVTPAGAVTLLGSTATDFKGLAFVGDTLYAVPRTMSRLYTLDPTTGSALTWISVTIPGLDLDGMNGLATHPDTDELWAVVRGRDSEGVLGRYLATIDPLTGNGTLIGNLGDQFAGIAFVPIVPSAVPEPAALGLLGLGALGIARLRRRRSV